MHFALPDDNLQQKLNLIFRRSCRVGAAVHCSEGSSGAGRLPGRLVGGWSVTFLITLYLRRNAECNHCWLEQTHNTETAHR